MRDGRVYVLPMQARPIGENGSSSLLNTPTVEDWKVAGPVEIEMMRRHHAGEVVPETYHRLRGQIGGLLPTPRHEGFDAGNHRGTPDGLDRTVRDLLPTPTAGDAKSARNSTATRHVLPPTGIHAGDTLTDILVPPGDPTNPPSGGGKP